MKVDLVFCSEVYTKFQEYVFSYIETISMTWYRKWKGIPSKPLTTATVKISWTFKVRNELEVPTIMHPKFTSLVGLQQGPNLNASFLCVVHKSQRHNLLGLAAHGSTGVHILDDTVCVSFGVNFLRKGMKPLVPTSYE